MSDQVEALKRKALEAGIIDQDPAIGVLLDDPAERPELPRVLLPLDGRLNSDFNRDVGAVLSGKGLYRYRDRLVTVKMNSQTGRPDIETVDPHRFRSWVENHLVCYRLQFNRHGAVKVNQTMGVDVAATCIVSDAFLDQQRRLLRVNTVRLPIQRASGAIELLPTGYDEESGILTVGTSWDYDEDMTVEAAFFALEDLVKEFPFLDARSKAVFFAAFFGQYGYFLQPLDTKRMGFLMHANSAGCGKGLLVEMLLTVVWGVASVDPMPDKTKDLKDRLDTAVREAKQYIAFDDLDQTYLRSGTLNAFITASWWSGRKFHAQEEFSEPKTPVIFLTANNLELTSDLSRRLLTCDLFAPEADIQERKINRVIDAEWLRLPNIRRQLCSALWTLVKAWRDAGRPSHGRQVAGFQSWSALYGGLVMNSGWDDPCVPLIIEGFGNTEYSDMLALITHLASGVAKSVEFEFIDIVNACRELNCFGHMIKGKLVRGKGAEGEDIAEFTPSDETNSSFGKLLGRYGGKAFTTKDGKRVIFDKRGKNRHKKFVLQVADIVGS